MTHLNNKTNKIFKNHYKMHYKINFQLIKIHKSRKAKKSFKR